MKKKDTNKLLEGKNFLEKWIKKEENRRNLNLVALFVLGFLLGVMLKSQALKTLVSGFDDYKAMQSDEIEFEEILPNENLEV